MDQQPEKKEILPTPQAANELLPIVERKSETVETRQDNEQANETLRREIELMNLDPNLQQEAVTKAKKIQILAEEERLEELVKMAREKGVIFAVKTAQSMNDPYMLDMLHDLLAKNGYYKEFLTKAA